MEVSSKQHPTRMTLTSSRDVIDDIAIGQHLAALLCSAARLVSVWRLEDEALLAEIAIAQDSAPLVALRSVRVWEQTLHVLDTSGELSVWSLPGEPYERLRAPQHTLRLNQPGEDQLTRVRDDYVIFLSRAGNQLYVSRVAPRSAVPDVVEKIHTLPEVGALLDASILKDGQLLLLCSGMGLLRLDLEGRIHTHLTLKAHDPKIEPVMSVSDQGHVTLAYKNKREDSQILKCTFTFPDKLTIDHESGFTYGKREIPSAAQGRLLTKSYSDGSFHLYCVGVEDTPAQFGLGVQDGERWKTQLSSDGKYMLIVRSELNRVSVVQVVAGEQRYLSLGSLCFFRESEGRLVAATQDRRCKVAYLKKATENM